MYPPTLVRSVPRVFVGPSPELLDGEPPGRVVSLCPTERAFPGQLLFPMADTQRRVRMPERHAFEAFIEAADRATTEGPTYWHCHLGLNRAPFAVAAWHTRHRGMAVADAVATLRGLRGARVLENELFVHTLFEWYPTAPNQPDSGVGRARTDDRRAQGDDRRTLV